MRGHASSERQKYMQDSFTATLAAEANRAALHAPNGAAGRAVIAETITRTLDTITAMAPELGLAADDVQVTNMKAEAVAKIHGLAVTAMIDARQMREAADYWAKVRPQVQDAETLSKVDGLLKQRTTETIAFDAVSQVLRELGPKPGDDKSVLSLDVYEARVRELLTDPDEQQVAIGELRSRVAGIEAGRKSRLDKQKFDIWSLVNGKTITELQSGRVTAAIDATQASKDNPQEALSAKNYIQGEIDRVAARANAAASRAAAAESRAASADARALAGEERDQRRLERDHWSEYYSLRTPESLATLTPGQILALTPAIGERHVNRLMQDLEDYQAGLGRLDAQAVDRDLLNDMAVRAGLTYFAAPSTANTAQGKTQRANVAKVLAAVNDDIKKKQRDPKVNRALSREEQRVIIQQLLDDKVTRTDAGWFFYDEDEFAILVDPTDQTAFIPWDTLVASERHKPAAQQYMNWFAGNPQLARLPEAEKRRRIERAYAVRLGRGCARPD